MISRWSLVVALLLGLSNFGCSGEGPAYPVEPEKARGALKTVLESWKKGEAVDGLKTANPPIIVQDFDWSAGGKLTAYEVTSEGKYDDSNLLIPVTLTLQPPRGKERKLKVIYVVSTSPAITVFRDFK